MDINSIEAEKLYEEASFFMGKSKGYAYYRTSWENLIPLAKRVIHDDLPELVQSRTDTTMLRVKQATLRGRMTELDKERIFHACMEYIMVANDLRRKYILRTVKVTTG
jgi:hypothetical protein